MSRLTETLHLEHGAYDAPKITAENADVVKKIIDSGLEEFSRCARGLIMGERPENRLVYRTGDCGLILRTSAS